MLRAKAGCDRSEIVEPVSYTGAGEMRRGSHFHSLAEDGFRGEIQHLRIRIGGSPSGERVLGEIDLAGSPADLRAGDRL